MTLAALIRSHPSAARRFDQPIDGTDAFTAAQRNFDHTRAAIGRRFPHALAALPATPPNLEWLFARDRSLSARVNGHWFNEQSVPTLAARKMLTKLTVGGTTVVFLAPTHATQIRRALELMPSTHALIAVVPGEFNAGVMIACEDFSADVDDGRLWLAVGPDWQDELRAVLEANEGLSPPSTMIRISGLNAAVVESIARPADVLLARHAGTHKQAMASLAAKPRAAGRVTRACVLGGPFAVWNDAACQLAASARRAKTPCVTIDAGSPLQASDLFLARAADKSDAIVIPNVGRADRPGTVSEGVAWITWVTRAAVPTCVPGAILDRVVLADEAMLDAALAAGWARERINFAREPHVGVACETSAHARPAIIMDLPAVAPPASVEEMSSLRLVWERTEADLRARPVAVRGDLETFLFAHADAVGVPRGSLPVALFRECLVWPTFAKAAAIELARRGVAFTIYGSGWENVPEARSRWRGPITSAAAWYDCLEKTAAILNVWPDAATHPAKRAGRALIDLWGRTSDNLTTAIARASHTNRISAAPPLDLDTIFARLSV